MTFFSSRVIGRVLSAMLGAAVATDMGVTSVLAVGARSRRVAAVRRLVFGGFVETLDPRLFRPSVPPPTNREAFAAIRPVADVLDAGLQPDDGTAATLSATAETIPALLARNVAPTRYKLLE
ncbi:hypothetical protein [Chenggangzhangella methanolivorans]|uniref:Uncharacterized protein n=1 Tax=Chenggangzhangella methanolivorans TaxID=1437009 RepID=A0A9E6UPM7_9HYPH|nr:hypothetical protein [Chenggangzhangella methanolivorans]QZO02566.1 hypothetical protein K6K41_02450 [Chenggangzhangella methanolivorans]